MARLLSIEDISRETGLEESLLRFYESEYPDDLPERILHGGTLAFDAKAVESFKRIHAIHSGGAVLADIGRDEGRFARVIAVTSGKGGVGKSNIALNLAIELQRLGKMSVLLDADMGMANAHLLAGITPRGNIMDLIAANKSITDVLSEGPEGIGIIPGGGGVLALADSSRQDRLKVVRALAQVEKTAEIILVDTGAGMSSSVRDFLVSADEVLFVLTPDVTSLADAYGLLKVLHQDRNFTARQVYSVVNMVQTLRQAADVARRFSGCARHFLGREVDNIGYVLRDATVGAATVRRTPYSVFRPGARVSVNTRNVAAALLQDEMPEIRLNSAFGRYMNLVRDRRRSAHRPTGVASDMKELGGAKLMNQNDRKGAA